MLKSKNNPPKVTQIDTRMINEDLLELTEEILEGVQSGMIVSGAFVMVQNNATTGNAWSGGYPLMLIAELEILKREIIDANIDLRHHNGGDHY